LLCGASTDTDTRYSSMQRHSTPTCNLCLHATVALQRHIFCGYLQRHIDRLYCASCSGESRQLCKIMQHNVTSCYTWDSTTTITAALDGQAQHMNIVPMAGQPSLQLEVQNTWLCCYVWKKSPTNHVGGHGKQHLLMQQGSC
jgi:hypothetical protein